MILNVVCFVAIIGLLYVRASAVGEIQFDSIAWKKKIDDYNLWLSTNVVWRLGWGYLSQEGRWEKSLKNTAWVFVEKNRTHYLNTDCYVPGLYILFFPMVRNGIVNFCSEF